MELLERLGGREVPAGDAGLRTRAFGIDQSDGDVAGLGHHLAPCVARFEDDQNAFVASLAAVAYSAGQLLIEDNASDSPIGGLGLRR